MAGCKMEENVKELLSLKINKQTPLKRSKYVTKLQNVEKYERRKQQNREAQRRARKRRSNALDKMEDFQQTIADLRQQIIV